MGLVMTNENANAFKTVTSRDPMSEDYSYINKLIEFVWTKTMERHRTANSAFRFFDSEGRGQIKKSDLFTGFEKLRIKLSNEDFSRIWGILDCSHRGRINYNEFCVLGE